MQRGTRASVLGGTESMRKSAQEVPCDRRVLLHQWPELPVREALTHELGRRSDRRRAGAVVDERDLAEVAAGREVPDLPPPERHRRLARLDDEERGPAGAFLRDRLAGLEAPLLEHRGDALDVAR